MKYFAAVLSAPDLDVERKLLPLLEEAFGRIDHRGSVHPFDLTDYYEAEMGRGLGRFIVSFEPLGSPTGLVRAKHAAAAIEERLAAGGGRSTNVDPGYIDFFKAVLASFKEGPQKIYLGEGVWGDPVLHFQAGEWRSLEWTFPDFKAGLYTEDFNAIRAVYRKARRQDSEIIL